MTTISGSTPVSTYNPYSTTGNLNSAQAKEGESDKKLTIEITPGEDNVSSGDKSQNTAQISITTPDKELEFEVNREQVFNAVERRSLKKAVTQPGDQGLSPLAKAAALESGALDSQEAQALATAKMTQDKIDTYSKATQQANSIYGNDDSDDSFDYYSTDDSNTAVQNVNDARSAYYKQELFFSTLDRIGFGEKA